LQPGGGCDGGPDTPVHDDEVLEFAKALVSAARAVREPGEWAGITLTPWDYIAAVAWDRIEIDTVGGPRPV
jgi:hypothetical protein